jgi:hypothetical protein
VEISSLYTAVHLSARVSAMLFGASLAVPALFRIQTSGGVGLYVAFVAAHSVHFAFVTWLARATDGVGIFPGGRDMAEVGGWPALFGIFTFFYVLAFLGLAARLRANQAGASLRAAGKVSTLFIGFMFVSTYVPLVSRSPWYALPATLVTLAVLVDVAAPRVRRWCR